MPGNDELHEHRQILGPGCCARTPAPPPPQQSGCRIIGLAKGTWGRLRPTKSIVLGDSGRNAACAGELEIICFVLLWAGK